MSDRIEASDILSEDATAKIKEFNETIKQTAAYAASLNKVVNSMGKTDFINSSSIAQHNKDIAAGTKELNNLNAAKLKSSKIAFEAAKLVEKEAKAFTKANEDAIKSTNKLAKEQENLNSVYSQTTKKYNELSKAQMELSVRGRENGKVFKAIKQEADALRASLDKAEQGAGRFQRNVGNYKSGFNGLSMSVNQLTREMPAFANSVQTGFMAISNNLPIFFDEISKANNELKALKAQGEKVPSLFKTLANSILSWGTLLSVGVTLLTVYGKELVSFIGDLFTASEANIKVIEDNNKAIDSIKDRIRQLGDEYERLAQRKMKAEGVLSEMDIKRNEAFKRYSDLEEKQRVELLQAAKDYTTEIGVYEENNITNRLEKRAELRKRLKELATAQQKELGDAARNLNAELAAIYIEENKATEKRSDEKVKVVKEAEIKIIDLSKQLRDAETNNITDSYDKQRAELTNKFNDDYELYKENAALILELKTKLDADLRAIDDKQKEDEGKGLVELRKAQGDHDKLLKSNAETKAKEAKSLKDKEAAEDKARLQATFDWIESVNNAKNNALEKQLNADLEMRQRNIIQQQALAMAGRDNTLAFEKAESAKDELRKIELAKREEKRAKGMAFLKLVSAYADNGDADGAVTKSLIQMAIAGAIIGSYEDGTEDTGGAGDVDGKGGKWAILHPNERVMTKGQNKMIGDISNEELAQIAKMHNEGLLPSYVTSSNAGSFAENITNSLLIKQFTTLNSKIESIEKTLKERPVSQVNLNNLGEVIDTKIINGFHKITVKKNGSSLNYL